MSNEDMLKRMIPNQIDIGNDCGEKKEIVDKYEKDIASIAKRIIEGYIKDGIAFSFDLVDTYYNDLEKVISRYSDNIEFLGYYIDTREKGPTLVVAITKKQEKANPPRINKQIIVINGEGGIGKDTMIDYFAEAYKYTVTNISSIDPVKRILVKDYNINLKTNKMRKFMSDIKDAMIEYDDGPLNYTIDQALNFISEKTNSVLGTDIMFVHIREWSEIVKFIDKIKELYPMLYYNDYKGNTTYIAINTLLCEDSNKVEVVEYGNSSDDGVKFHRNDYDYVFGIVKGDKDGSCARFGQMIEFIIKNNNDFLTKTIEAKEVSPKEEFKEKEEDYDTSNFFIPKVVLNLKNAISMELTADYFHTAQVIIDPLYRSIFKDYTRENFNEKRHKFNQVLTHNMNEHYKDHPKFDCCLIGAYIYITEVANDITNQDHLVLKAGN